MNAVDTPLSAVSPEPTTAIRLRPEAPSEIAPEAHPTSLRAEAPWRVLDGFGRSMLAACRYAAPHTYEDLLELLLRARQEGLHVTFRGSGRSYGDASLNSSGLVIDLTPLNRMLHWNPVEGIAEAEPGLTIEGLWRRTLQDGFWPAVVPGTMRPTLGGCVSMNIHGKNNFHAGPFGEHVLDFDLVTPRAEVLHCSPQENAEVFYAAIGGLGLLGAITRVRLRLRPIESGLLRVDPLCARNLDEMFALFEERLPHADYLVGWVDCLAAGRSLGRGEIHQANYLQADEDPLGPRSFDTERQCLPGHILGIPKAQLWRLMRPVTNNLGVGLVNALKYYASRWHDRKTYVQSHVAFAFLLDYIPDWRLAYGPGGLIQYQVFLPKETAQPTLEAILKLCRTRGLPSYLGVLKRHRPDAFLLSHAVDGYSFAMDFRVTRSNRAALWKLTEAMTELVLEAGGRFYFAKDSVLRPQDVTRAYGTDRLNTFFALKKRLDPDGILSSDLSRRIVGPGQQHDHLAPSA